MTLHEQGFHSLPILAGLQREIPYPPRDIRGGVQVGMGLEATDHATKGLLIGAIRPVWIMAVLAFLGGIGALDRCGLYPSLRCVPCNLLGDVGEVGSAHMGIHGSCLVLHRGTRKLFIGKLCAFMLSKALIHRPVDLLLDMPDEALPTLVARRGQLFDPLLFQTLAELGLAAALLAVSLLPVTQLAIERPVVPTIRGGQEVGNADIHPDHRSIGCGVNRHDLIIGKRQPPHAILALIELHAGIELPHLPRLWVGDLFFVVRRQLDGDKQGLAEFQSADLEPVVKGGVVRGFKRNDVGVRLDAGLSKGGNVPLFPGRCLRTFVQGVLGLLLVIVQQVVHIILVGLLPIGAPGLRNACGLLDGDPVPAFGERGGKAGSMKGVWQFVGTEKRGVVLRERKKDLSECIECRQLAWIGFHKTDMGHGLRDALWLSFFRSLLSLLHRFHTRLRFIQVLVSLLYGISSFTELAKRLVVPLRRSSCRSVERSPCCLLLCPRYAGAPCVVGVALPELRE